MKPITLSSLILRFVSFLVIFLSQVCITAKAARRPLSESLDALKVSIHQAEAFTIMQSTKRLTESVSRAKSLFTKLFRFLAVLGLVILGLFSYL